MASVKQKFPKGSSKKTEKKEIAEIAVDDPFMAYVKKLGVNLKPVSIEIRKKSPSPKKKSPPKRPEKPKHLRVTSPKKKTPSPKEKTPSPKKKTPSPKKTLSPKKASPKSFSKMSVVELRIECKERKIPECQGSKYIKKDDLLKLLAQTKSKSISPKKTSPKKAPAATVAAAVKRSSPKKSKKKSPSPKKIVKHGKQEEGEKSPSISFDSKESLSPGTRFERRKSSEDVSLPSMKKRDSFEIEISCFEPGQECSDLEFCDADKLECVPQSSKTNKDFILQLPSKKTKIIGSESKLKALKGKYGGVIKAPKPEILKVVSDEGMLKKSTKDVSPVYLDFEKEYEQIPEMTDKDKKDIDAFIKGSIKDQSKIKVKSPKKLTQPSTFMPKLSNRALEEYAKLEATVKKCLESL